MAAGVGRGEIVAAMREMARSLEEAGAPFFTGSPYRGSAPSGADAVSDVNAEIEAGEELDRVLARALDVLARRGILVASDGRLRTDAAHWVLVEYYANSLRGHHV